MPTQRTRFIPLAPVRLIKPNGQIRDFGYGKGSDTDHGAALLSAVDAALYDDIVEVNADATIDAPIAKSCRLRVAPGVTLSSPSDYLISDAGGAITLSLEGGQLTSYQNTIHLTNSSSNVTVKCESIVSSNDAVHAANGTLYVEAGLINGAVSGIYWIDGDCYVKAQKIYSGGSYAIWCECPDSTAKQLWVKAQHIDSVYQTIFLSSDTGNASNARVWIDAELINSTSTTGTAFVVACYDLFGYITCQKISSSRSEEYVSPLVLAAGDAHFYLTTQKLGVTDDGTSNGYNLIEVQDNALAVLSIGEVDDSAGSLCSSILTQSGGTSYVTLGKATMTNATTGISVSGGTCNLLTGYLTTPGTNTDLVRSGGTLRVHPGFVYNGSKTTGTITLGAAWGTTPTTAGLNLLSGASTSAQRTTLGLGTGDSPTFASVTAGAFTNSTNDATSNKALHLKFDGNVNDSSGNGRNGSVTGTTTYSNYGVYGQAFSLNGSSKVVVSGLLGSPANVSISLWANLFSADVSGSDVIEIGTAIAIRLDAGGTLQFIIEASSGFWITPNIGQPLAGLGWHHIACVFDDTNDRYSIWLDGVCRLQGASSSSIYYGGGGDTVIGQHPSNGSFDFTGLVDDLRVYSVALTPMQIKQLAGWVTTPTP